MPIDHRTELKEIRTFPSLVRYLRDEMGWPIDRGSFEDMGDLFFDFTADELGIDPKTAAKIQEIKRLRPLSPKQPWGIFFVKFEPKRLPVVALRRILSSVALKKRSSANSDDRVAWAADDLLFVSNYGEGDRRQISFAHFSQDTIKGDLPTLKVLGWDNLDTPLHLDHVAELLTERLAWPDDESDVTRWRRTWGSAFILRPREVITTSKVLAVRLAELARAIRDRVRTVLNIETDKGPVTKLMKAFQEALVHDLDADGFADMYAQTIAYGLLSARITNPKANTADDLAAQLPVTNPFLKELMESFLRIGDRRGKANGLDIDFDELGVSEVVELLDDANMENVVRDFGDKNPQEDPVIHFYEHFLKEYDAKQKAKRGVFYTPRPVVSYIVRSVDELLRTEFGLEDGLADTTIWSEMIERNKDLVIPNGTDSKQAFIQILDPATGTGTFLVEVIDLIHNRMMNKWKIMGHGEEKIRILWNEYVPEHLLPRLHGYELLMAPYAVAHLKIGLKLYETGYRFGSNERVRVYLTNALEPASDIGQQSLMGAFSVLAHEAEAVNKVKQKKQFTVVIGNPPYSNYGQLNRIPFILDLLEDYKRGLKEKKINLDDDFIKFIRFAEHQLTRTKIGCLGLITNSSYLDGVTHRVMRAHLLASFSRIEILNLHGSTQREEINPLGDRDKNVFDIKQGVAIGIFAVTKADCIAKIAYADLWGLREDKYKDLANGKTAIGSWTQLTPTPDYYFLTPKVLTKHAEYENGMPLTEIFSVFQNGIKTDRDDLFVADSQEQLGNRIQTFYSEAGMKEPFRSIYRIEDSSSYQLIRRRANSTFNQSAIRLCLYRPFDMRWLYYQIGVTSRPAFDVMQHILNGDNMALLSCRQQAELGFRHVFVTKLISECCAVSLKTREITSVFPLWLSSDNSTLGFGAMKSNLTRRFIHKLAESLDMRGNSIYTDAFFFIYAICHSPCYRSRYAEFLKIDFPRIPLPVSPPLFCALAQLGGELVTLHLMESPKLNSRVATFLGDGHPEVERVSYSDETVWIDKAKSTGFRGISENIWNFHIGGYQVCEKWLKDRKGRTLSEDDIVHYQKIIVALSETIRLMKEIDEVIDQHGGWPGAFQN